MPRGRRRRAERTLHREAERKIACHISEKTAHLYTALEVNLDEVIEKHSALLGREAQYSQEVEDARLPPSSPCSLCASRGARTRRSARRSCARCRSPRCSMCAISALLSCRRRSPHTARSLEEERDAASGGKKDIAKDAEKIAIPDGAPQPGAAGSSSDAMDVSDILKPKTPEELAELAEGRRRRVRRQQDWPLRALRDDHAPGANGRGRALRRLGQEGQEEVAGL